MPTPKRIFLSYAREDKDAARRLYRELKNNNEIEIWFDEVSLSAGDYWRSVIDEEIKKSDYFILLFSSKSVAKEGFINIEIRKALEKSKRMPEGRKFIIPLRLDECKMSFKDLRNLHHVDLFPENEYGGIVEGILDKIIGKRKEEKSDPDGGTTTLPTEVIDVEVGYKKHILIWHAGNDIEQAKQIHDFLNQRKFKTLLFNEEKINNPKQITKIVEDASYFIPLLSKSLEQLTATEEKMLTEATRKQKSRQLRDKFIIPIKVEDFSVNKYMFIQDIYPVEMLSRDGSVRFEAFQEAMNKLLEAITNHLQFWDFEGKNKDLLENATADAVNRYMSIITNHTKSKEKLYRNDYFAAGLNSFAKKNYKDALKRFLLASNHGFDIERPEVLSKIGACYIKMGSLEQAKEVLKLAIEKDENYPTSWYNQGILFKMERRLEEARKSFQKAIDKMRKNSHTEITLAINNMSTTYLELFKATGNQKHLKEAINLLETEIAEDEDKLTEYNLACLYSLLANRENEVEYKKNIEKSFTFIEQAFEEKIEHIEDGMKDIELAVLRTESPKKFWDIIDIHGRGHKASLYTKLGKMVIDGDAEGVIEASDKLKKASDIVDIAYRNLEKLN